MAVAGVGVVGVVVGALAGPSAGHHGRCRMTVHAHVAHGGWVGAGIAAGPSPVALVDHRLDYPPAGVDEPVVDLEDGEAGVLGQLFLLVLAGVGVGQMLEQPGAQDVGCHLGENAALLAVLAALAAGVVVIAAAAVGATHAGVGRVAGLRQVVPAGQQRQARCAAAAVLAR